MLLFAAMWIEQENIILSEISQTEKDKYSMISLICGISENKTNKCIQPNRNRYRKQTSDYQWGKGGGEEQDRAT